MYRARRLDIRYDLVLLRLSKYSARDGYLCGWESVQLRRDPGPRLCPDLHFDPGVDICLCDDDTGDHPAPDSVATEGRR